MSVVLRYGPIAPSDLALAKHQDMRLKPRVFEPLRASVQRGGFANPIIVWATHGEIRPIYGITRAWVASDLNIPVPAVIVDYDGRFPAYERLHTVDDVANKYTAPDVIRPYLKLSDSKLWMNIHPRVPVNPDGDHF